MTHASIAHGRPTASRPAGDNAGASFRHVVRAEWIKFRSVRGWVIGMIAASLLTLFVGVFLAGNANIGCGPTLSGRACLPKIPIGPGGEAVTYSFYFVRQPLAGNGSLTVRVASLATLISTGSQAGPVGQGPPNPLANMHKGLVPWAKAGIIITASTRQGSAYAAIMVTGSHGVRMQYDYIHDGAGMPGEISSASPRWLRLTRNGDVISGYDSADGKHWDLVGTATLSGLPGTVQAGPFATSPIYDNVLPFFGGAHIQGGPSQATTVMDEVTQHGHWPAARWTGDNIGGSGNSPATGVGYFRRSSSGALTISGSGNIAPLVPGPGSFYPTTTIEQPLAGIFIGLIAVVVVAAMFFTAEYRRGLIRTTLAATPNRGHVLAAKAAVVASVAFLAGLVASVIAVPLDISRARNEGQFVLPVPMLTEVRVLIGTAAMVAVAAILAVAVGAILRRSAAAVTTVIVVIVLPFLLSVTVLPDGVADWVLRLTPAAGFAIEQSIPNYSQVSSISSPAGGVYPLTPWAGFGVLCLYAVVALALATVLLRRRDA